MDTQNPTENHNGQPNPGPTASDISQPLIHSELPTPASPPPIKRPSRKIFLLALVFLILLIVAGFSLAKHSRKPRSTANSTSLKHISVRLEWINNPEFTGMYIAKEKGYYKSAGFDVELKEFEDGTDVNKEVATGVVDYGVSTPLEIILAIDKGEKNKAIAAFYQTSAYSIATQKNANIKNPSDFKGKILGNSGNNNEAKVTYAALMGAAGLKPSDATIKPVGFDIIQVFKNNEAQSFDVYRTDQTYLLDQAHIAYDQIFPEQFGFSIYGDVLIANDSMIRQHPAQTRAFVQATMKGWQYAIDHPDEALTIIDKYANKLYKDLAYEKYDLDSTLPLIKTTGNLPLGGMQYVPWNRAYQGVKDAGLLQANFNPTDAYTTEFVR